MTMKTHALIIAFVTIFHLAVSLPASVASEKPNIIFIMADDLGYGDLGCYGQTKIKTPHLDQMASEGMRFTDYYSGQAVCSPSRASLMLGLDMGHCRIIDNGNAKLLPDEITVAQRLQAAGYTTGMIGKWGLDGTPDHPGAPNKKGFDHWFGFQSQGYAHFYYPQYLYRNTERITIEQNMDVRQDGHYRPGKGQHVHDMFAAEAETFLRANANKTFFLYLPFAIPHAELVVPADDPGLAEYRALGWPEKKKLEGGGGGAYGSPYTKGYCACDYPNATYAAMITKLDRTIGHIFALLKELNLDEKTLVIFTSDNGPSGEGGQDMTFFNSQGPLRGFKRSIYEGGSRVPMIARWPGHIAKGQVSSKQIAAYDFMPTACELADIPVNTPTNGISFLPTLQSRQQIERSYLYFRWGNTDALRSGKWKLVRKKTKENEFTFELYDLEADIGEKHDLAKENEALVTSLANRFETARAPIQ